MKLAPPRPEHAEPEPDAAERLSTTAAGGRQVGSRARLSTALKGFAVLLAVAGTLALTDGVLTLLWQEPISGLLAHFDQVRLAENLKRIERQPVTSADQRALVGLPTDDQRMAYFARRLRQNAGAGQAVGRIRIPRINANFVVVAGTDESSLQKGPGIYSGGAVPGLGGTVGIAGHRTTYLAPFRRINELAKGDRITMEMPYGLFTYTVLGHRIVSPGDVTVLRAAAYDQVVLTACNPLYSAAQRIVVFARLTAAAPAGGALAVPISGAVAPVPVAPATLPAILGDAAPAELAPLRPPVQIGSGEVVVGGISSDDPRISTPPAHRKATSAPTPAPSLPSAAQAPAPRPPAIAPVHISPAPPVHLTPRAPTVVRKPTPPAPTKPPAAVPAPGVAPPPSAQTRIQGRPGGPAPIIDVTSSN